jgi:hypothetical protein
MDLAALSSKAALYNSRALPKIGREGFSNLKSTRKRHPGGRAEQGYFFAFGGRLNGTTVPERIRVTFMFDRKAKR